MGRHRNVGRPSKKNKKARKRYNVSILIRTRNYRTGKRTKDIRKSIEYR